MDDVEEEHLFIQESKHDEPKLLPLGRVLTILLSAPYKTLQKLFLSSNHPFSVSNDEVSRSAVMLVGHIQKMVHRGSSLDPVFIPLLEHVVKSTSRCNCKKVSLLILWLLGNKELGTILAHHLVKILGQKHCDHSRKLGWCLAVSELVQAQPKEQELFEAIIILVNSVPQLLGILVESSDANRVERMPTRLSIAAADCILILTLYILEAYQAQGLSKKQNVMAENLQPLNIDDGGEDLTITVGERLLWAQLDNLLALVVKLKEWNEKSRPLHWKGLEQVEKRLQDLAAYRDSPVAKVEAGFALSVGPRVLSALWKHFGPLIILERPVHSEYKDLLLHWLDGLQHTVQQLESGDELASMRNVDEVRRFFLACLALLLGRLQVNDLNDAIEELGSQLLNALISQLRGKNIEIAELAATILRTLLYSLRNSKHTMFKMDTIAPLIIDLLDERDAAAKAVVLLIADYLVVNPDAPELQRLFGLLDCGNIHQRRNVLEVISELFHMAFVLGEKLASNLRESLASHLLNRLGDEELTNRVESAHLFAQLDPKFVLPALVQRVYSRDEKLRSAAASAVIAVLNGHDDQCTVLCVLLDSLSNMIPKVPVPLHPGQIGAVTDAKLPDVDRIMKLIPRWSSKVKNWDPLIHVLLKKMFSDPSNVVMPRFLSQISSFLCERAPLVFQYVLEYFDKQQGMTEDLLATSSEGLSDPDGQFSIMIFERISPLLVLKVLPLKAFDDSSCTELYVNSADNLYNTVASASRKCLPQDRIQLTNEEKCITNFLIERACGLFEFEDVRKLSAELLGRLLPSIILPVLTQELESVVAMQDIVRVKACLFALCTSLWLRKKESLYHPSMNDIRNLLLQVLLWPCSTTDKEIAKAQHGSIDCLALMICAELSSELAQTYGYDGSDHKQESVFSCVLSCLIGQQPSIRFLDKYETQAKSVQDAGSGHLLLQTSLRLCMANVFISVTQKISIKERPSFASQLIPPIMRFVQESTESKIKAACMQVLLTAVYHLKETIILYAIDLLNLSLSTLRSKQSTEERIAAARLLTSLLAAEESILSNLEPCLLDVKIVLARVSCIDTSSEVRSLCERLLDCLTIKES